MSKPQFPLVTAIWISITVLMLGLSVRSSYSLLQKRLNNNTQYVYSSVYEKTYINEILLQNFTALVSANPRDFVTIRSYANEMHKRYPQIMRLQIQQQAPSPPPEQTVSGPFEPLFGQPDLSREVLANTNFPLTFIEPLTADTRYLMGHNLEDDPALSETLSFAQRYHQPVSSAPFRGENTAQVYALFLAFYDRNAAPNAQNLYIASIIVNIASLLPNANFMNEGARAQIISEHDIILDERTATENTGLGSDLLPPLKDTRTINRFGQSFKLYITQKVSLQDLNPGLLLAILFCSAGGYALLLAYLRQRVRSASQHAQLYEKLKKERQQLELRIHMRTQELRDQLIENRRLTHQVLAVQEKERRSLSRELHDELGQSLTAIRTDAKILKRIHPEENNIVHQTADSIDAIAQNIYDVTYGLMRTLRPTALDDLGLMDALQECIANNRFAEHNIHLHTDFRGALNEMSEDYNITLFRLTQESFSNILKYAHAKNVRIELHRLEKGQRGDISGDRLELLISDDGVGFDVESQAFKSGFGLIGMRERVRALGGTFSVRQNHDRGTRITAVIPIVGNHNPQPDSLTLSR
ncbi:ATP-binding protein [Aliamphritea hakodatensis]|uniref:ATP-binding protein n=1 Tax=Aliamphritea hakodatensis TaxID=2895352 RepID=UPI0022FD5C3D|nr:ATP-binding protein [Aliamphritea hakodatensis]